MDLNDIAEQQQTIIFEGTVQQLDGELKLQKYQLGKFLGKENQAYYYEATNLETNEMLLSKIIAKSTLTKIRVKQRLISEIRIHSNLQNANIMQFKHVIEDDKKYIFYLNPVLFRQQMNFQIRVKNLQKKKFNVIQNSQQMRLNIYRLRILYTESNIQHQTSIKLSNLFLNKSKELKLGDFSCATKLEFKDEKKRTICGSSNYLAPEILDGKNGYLVNWYYNFYVAHWKTYI